jgi:hypothetical protein
MIGIKFHSPDNQRSLLSVISYDKVINGVTLRLSGEYLRVAFDASTPVLNYFEGIQVVEKQQESIWYAAGMFLKSNHPGFLVFDGVSPLIIANPDRYFKMWGMTNGFEERTCTRIFP